ncbi:MAG: RNA polymerase subunit sigma-54 [Aquificaceae bacterium]
MVRGELKTTVKPKLNLSILLRHDIELLTKTAQDLEHELEKEKSRNSYISYVVKRVPTWFFREEIKPREPIATSSVYEQLLEQINLEFDEDDRDIALEILYRVDHDGFLKCELEDIAKAYGVSVDYVEDIREFIMMEMEPVGVASKNLEEFLEVQLREMYPEDADFRREVLQSIKSGKVDKGLKDIISRLRLRPISGEGGAKTTSRVDLLLEHDGESWYLFIQDDFIDIEIKEDQLQEDELSKEKLRKAKSLKFLIEMRRKVLRSIGQLLIERQEGFLLRNEPLKSLTVKNAAERIGVSISTVSRVINSKYVKTPIGTFPLRFFFVKESKGGVSKEEVMRAIREVVEMYDSLSDREVSELLRSRNINIARRTVAKYRKLLGLR